MSAPLFPLLSLSAQLKWCFIIIWLSEINSSHDYAQKDTVLDSHSLIIRAEPTCVKQQMGRNQSGQTNRCRVYSFEGSQQPQECRPCGPPVTCPAVIGPTAYCGRCLAVGSRLTALYRLCVYNCESTVCLLRY